MMHLVRVGSAALVLVVSGCAAPETVPEDNVSIESQVLHPDEGKLVRRIEMQGCDAPERVVDVMKTRVGDPLSAALLAEDIQLLWRRERLVVEQVFTEPAAFGDGVYLTVVVLEAPSEVQVIQGGDAAGILWGAGVSTGTGVRGSFQFSKSAFPSYLR